MIAPTVMKLGGAVVEDPQSAGGLLEAIAQVAASRPLVVLHGGGKAVDRLLGALKFEVRRVDGLRVTPPDQMDIIAGVLAGTVNKRVTGGLLARGVRAVGLCLGDGGAVPTRRLRADLGLVGEVVSDGSAASAPLLTILLASGFTPVLSSIGMDAAGGLLNVNADDAAAGVARLLGAKELVLLTDVPGVLRRDGSVAGELDGAQIERMIACGEITGGMAIKVRAAEAAATAAGAPVTILSGADPAALAAWASGAGSGTRIVPGREKA